MEKRKKGKKDGKMNRSNLSRYVLPNVDPLITHLQICANLEIGEGEKNCTQELKAK